jgi:hypothetical protein
MAEGEAHRIRATGLADSERMASGAPWGQPAADPEIVCRAPVRQDAIVMVLMDGSNFFAADVFRAGLSPHAGGPGRQGRSWRAAERAAPGHLEVA